MGSVWNAVNPRDFKDTSKLARWSCGNAMGKVAETEKISEAMIFSPN